MGPLVRRPNDRKVWMLLGAGGALLLAMPAHGTVLAPGSGATVTPGTASLVGLNTAADQFIPFIGLDVFNDPVFSGTLESTVLYDPAHPEALIFGYRIVADLGPWDDIHTMTVDSFSAFTTDVDYVSGSGNNAYATASRGTTGSGSTLTFNFLATASLGIAPGMSSDWVLVKTNASQYTNGGITSIIDGGSVTVQTYEPVFSGGSSAPEPVTLGLMFVGGIPLFFRRGSRR
jgi:hypothetical protein